MIRFRLDELMSERGLTYEAVRDGAEVSTSTLYKMRKGKARQIGVETIGRLLVFFDCQPNDLIERVNGGQR